VEVPSNHAITPLGTVSQHMVETEHGGGRGAAGDGAVAGAGARHGRGRSAAWGRDGSQAAGRGRWCCI
jgi:hypothetical protein